MCIAEVFSVQPEARINLTAQPERISSLEDKQSDRAAADRIAEFERLLARHEQDLTALVFSMVPNWADTDDLVQRTRIVLWQKFSDYRPGTSFRRWAFQIARFEVRNHWRTKKTSQGNFDEALLDSLAATRDSMEPGLEMRRARLESCIAELRASDRQIIRFCYGPNATTAKEAALRLSRPVNTIYKALNRIRRTLVECVQRNSAEEDLGNR